MREVTFFAAVRPDGGFVARTAGDAIVVRATTARQLHDRASAAARSAHDQWVAVSVTWVTPSDSSASVPNHGGPP